jgi:hypothetical protein
MFRPRCSASHGRHAAWSARNLLGRACRDDVPAVRTAARPHVDEVVRSGEQVQVVIDHDDCGTGVQQPVEYANERGYVERVQAGGRLVKDVERAVLADAQPGGDP